MPDAAGGDRSDGDRRFFGAVTAGLSHELNNVFATVQELSGLLGDLAEAGERGRQPDPQRLKSIAQRIDAQVDRGQRQTKYLNRFAHSVDRQTGEVDVARIAEQVLALAGRVARLQQVELRGALPEQPVAAVASPFELYHLLWRCLQVGFAVVGPGGWVELSVQARAGGGVALHVTGSAPAAEVVAPTEHVAALSTVAKALGAEPLDLGSPPALPLTVVLPR